jgi:hypothetical protein
MVSAVANIGSKTDAYVRQVGSGGISNIFAFGLTNINHATAQPPDPCFDWAEGGE